MQNFEEFEEDINNLGDDCKKLYLTRQDYEKYLNTEGWYNNDESMNIANDYSYQGIVDNIMAELQQKYNLRPIIRNVTISPPKKNLPRGETDEVAPKDAER
jgi:hypothetical protein